VQTANGGTNCTGGRNSVELTPPVYVVAFSVSGINNTTEAGVKASVITANNINVTESSVTVTGSGRRLDEKQELRRLATSFAVEIANTDMAKAQAAQTSAANSSALVAALTASGVNAANFAVTAPAAQVKVTAVVTLATDMAPSAMATTLASGLATKIEASIQGATMVAGTVESMTIVIPAPPKAPTTANVTANVTGAPTAAPPMAAESASSAETRGVSQVFLVMVGGLGMMASSF